MNSHNANQMNRKTEPVNHPTDFAAFRKMIAAMNIPELREFSATIENDIKKHVEDHSRKADVMEWAHKIHLIAEEERNKKILKLEFAS